MLQFDKTGTGDLTNGDLSHRYLWGPAVDMLLADEQVDWTDMDADGEVLWALTDHLGTVRDVIDNSGTVVDHAQYDAFGNRLSAAAVDLLFGYTGKPFDEATGLQNNLHRWYDPAVGRWVSEDPIKDGTNWSAYVGNSPTMFVDPDGLKGYWAGVWDVFLGYGDAAVGTVEGLWFVVRHPIQTAKGVVTAIRHPIQTGQAIYDDVCEKSGTLRGQGQLVGDVLIGVASAGTVQAASKTATVAKIVNKLSGVKRLKLIIDEGKFGYLFGKATGRRHNIDRTAQNLAQMNRLGLADNTIGRELLKEHFDCVVQDAANISRTFKDKHGSFEVRESLFQGPSGAFAKFESTWEILPDGTRRLVTVIPIGGK